MRGSIFRRFIYSTVVAIPMCIASPAISQDGSEPNGDDENETQADDGPSGPPPVELYGTDYHDPWYTTVGLGTQFLPKYDEQGNSSGLSDQSFVALINIDSVWDCKKEVKKDGKSKIGSRRICLGSRNRIHFGGTLLLSGSPTQNAERNTGQPDASDSNPCGTNGVLPGCFNDVDDVVTFSSYLDLEVAIIGRTKIIEKLESNGEDNRTYEEEEQKFYYRSGHCDCYGKGGKEDCRCGAPTTTFGFVARASVQSRDKLGTDNDSAIWFASLGAKIASHRYRARGYRNGIPAGLTEFSVALFEEYAGERDEVRYLFNVQRTFFKNVPLYVGAFGNFGSGEDVIGISLVYLVEPEGFVNLFSPGDVRN